MPQVAAQERMVDDGSGQVEVIYFLLSINALCLFTITVILKTYRPLGKTYIFTIQLQTTHNYNFPLYNYTNSYVYKLCSWLYKVWRIEDLELVPVDPKGYGYFYGGDCYLVLYTYEVNNRKHYLLYMWQVLCGNRCHIHCNLCLQFI